MKFKYIVFLLFFSMAVTNVYSVFSERYTTNKTFTGVGHTQSGDYSGHVTVINGDGSWHKTTTNCPSSPEVCFTRTNGVGWVEFEFNGLQGGQNLDTNSLDCYMTYINDNDSLVTEYIGPYVP